MKNPGPDFFSIFTMTDKSANIALNDCRTQMMGPNIRIGRLAYSAYRVFGLAGLMTAALLGVSLVAHLGLSQTVLAGIIIASVATFLLLAMATKIIAGKELLIYYHHEIAILLVAAITLWALNQPILPYLDITILGIGTFLAFGRIGCLTVGCCHGRPSHFGVCYGDAHAHAGFTPYYVGVRLFPIQVFESLWVFGIVLAGIAMLLHDSPAGAVLAWYVILYDIGRFLFEFMRGDPTRHYWKGFSEGQWTSLILIIVVVALEVSGRIPYESWHLATAVSLVMTMIAVSLQRRFQKTHAHQLTNPRHVREIADAIRAVSNSPAQQLESLSRSAVQKSIPVRSTSLGILISANRRHELTGECQHFAISSREGNMSEDIAETIGRIIFSLKRPQASLQMIKGKHGVYHFLLGQTRMERP